MPFIAGLIPIIAGISGALGLGEGIASLVSKPKTPTAPTTAPATAPSAPQIATSANTQYLTGGGVSPDYLQSLLNGSGLEPNPNVLSQLSGYTTPGGASG